MTLLGERLRNRLNVRKLPQVNCCGHILEGNSRESGSAFATNREPAKCDDFRRIRLFGKFWRLCGLVKFCNLTALTGVIRAAVLRAKNYSLHLQKNIFAANCIVAWRALAAICTLALSAKTPCASLLGETHIIENGSCDMEIILPQNVHRSDAEAANTLAMEAAKLARGGNIKVSFFDDNSRPKTKIFLKKSAKPQPPQELSAIRIKSGCGNIEIEYPDESRAMNAVGIFLRKFCGMRFYAPGELGTHFDKKENLNIPDGEFEFRDAFFSVGFYAPTKDAKRRGEVNRWLKLNGAHSIAGNFSHNLKNIFDEEFRRKHPEILARDSDGSIKHLAQYDILNPAAAAQAAKKADEYFLEYPQAKMFSVGIDDFSEFDERPKTLAHKRGYFRGFPDYSNAVFEFSAKSAQLIAQKHPSKLVGCIAYLACENPPSFMLPGNLVPYFTTDRANYFDAKYKELDFKTLDAWGKSAKFFGIYDYAHGSPYPFPWEIGSAVTEGIARAHKAGARAYYAELNPIYAYDAKKCAEIFAALENPENTDAAKIAGEEFYKNFYGRAGKYVKDFFDTAQNAQFAKRAARGDPVRWLGLFKLESSVEIFDENDISEMENSLRLAKISATASGNKKYIKRVESLELAFNFGKLCDREYRLKKKIFYRLNSCAATQEIMSLMAELRNLSNKKQAALKAYESGGIYPAAMFTELLFTDNLNPSIQAAQYLLSKGVNKSDISGIFTEEEIQIALAANRKDCTDAFGGDGSFENIAINEANEQNFSNGKWILFECDYDGAKMKISKRAARTGKYGAEFAMCENSAISKSLKAYSGEIFVFEGYYRGRITPGTACYATIVFFDKDGKYLGRKSSLFNVSEGDRFLKFICAAVAPENADSAMISLFASRMKDGDFLFVDDLSLKIIP